MIDLILQISSVETLLFVINSALNNEVISYLAYAWEFSLYSGPCTIEHKAVMTSALSKPMAGKRCRPRLVVSLSSHLERFRSLRNIDIKRLVGLMSTWF